MYSTPAAVLGLWFRGLLAIAIVVGAVQLLRTWYDELPLRTVPVATRVDRDGPGERDERRVEVATRPATFTERVTSWRPGFDRATALLAGGVLLLFLSIGGRLIAPGMFLRSTGEGRMELRGGQVSRIVRPDGTELHVEVHEAASGSAAAPTVVLTHGWGNNRHEWAYLKKAWGNRFRLVAWDLPGLGDSSRPPNRDYSMEKLASDLGAVVDFAGPGRVVLMGHSIGGMISQTFCRLFRERLGPEVAGVILVHTTYINPLRTMRFGELYTALQKPLVEPLLYLQIALSPLVWISQWMSYLNGSIHWTTARNGFGGNESREKLNFIAEFQPKASPAVIARGCLGMLQLDEDATLRQIPVPVLAIAAEDDPITLPEASDHIAGTAPAGRLHTLRSTKHFGLIEYDQEFSEVAAQFCESVSTTAKSQAS